MEENKKICQSCAMPMQNENDFGTNNEGSKNTDYCTYCYQNGYFTDEDITKVEKKATKKQFLN